LAAVVSNVTSMACWRATPAAHLNPSERLVVLILKDAAEGVWARDGMPVEQIEKQMGRYVARGFRGDDVTPEDVEGWQLVYTGAASKILERLERDGLAERLPSGNWRRS
jgi:hypothetical protein